MKNVISILSFLLLLSSCSQNNASKMIAKKFDIQGHRGCRGLLPENTINAFLHAIDLGVTTLELDVVITKDKKVIVSHEPWISAKICLDTSGNKITGINEKTLNIYEMTYENVKQYDCGSVQHKEFPDQRNTPSIKPKLNDVFQEVEEYVKKNNLLPIDYNIEIKSKYQTDNKFHPQPEEFVELILAVIEEYQLKSKVIIQSFDERILNVAHDKAPEIRTALLTANQLGFRHNLQRLDFTPTIFSPNHFWVTQSMISFFHKEGIQVIPWTINEEQRMIDLIEMGVDGIITDYPNILTNIYESIESN